MDVDHDVLRAIEKLVGKPIPLLSSTKETKTFGYAVDPQEKQVTGIYLFNAGLYYLPSIMGNLRKLRELDLIGNHLSALPDSLRRLIHLETLNLSNNNLSSVPGWIAELQSLRMLAIGDNKLDSFPEGVLQLKNLVRLDLYCNKIRSVPDAIGGLSALENLSLNDNKLTSLPESIGELRSLRSLIVQANDLASLPESIGKLDALESLLLLGNHRLTQLPRSFANSGLLNVIDMKHDGLMVSSPIPPVKGGERRVFFFDLEILLMSLEWVFYYIFLPIVLPGFLGWLFGFLSNLAMYDLSYAILNPNWWAILVPAITGGIIDYVNYNHRFQKLKFSRT